MKKVITAIACLLTVAALVSCSNTSPKDTETDSQDNTSAEVTNTEVPVIDTETPETSSDESAANPATDFQYEISKDGDSIYINKYIGTSENVVIPSEIDGLPVYSLNGIPNDEDTISDDEGVFENCVIKTVTIPESVVIIGANAFKNCKELTEVSVSQNIKAIFNNAFVNCTKLEKIDLSETKLIRLDHSAFRGCTNLCEVKLPASLLEIGKYAFCDCSSLLEIHLPENLVEIGMEAFGNCTSLKTITVPTELELFADMGATFYNMPSLEKIIFEEGREKITGYAFFDITSNPEIIIPKSVKRFSPYTFFIHGTARFVFLGDCPEIVDTAEFYNSEPTIYYDSTTKGWEDCVWKDNYTLEPIK